MASFSQSPSISGLLNQLQFSSLSSSSVVVSFRQFSPPFLNRKRPLLSINSASLEAPSAVGGVAPAIALADNALRHLKNKMRLEKNKNLCLRIGVKQGESSGMSYTMEFEGQENTRPDDSVIVCHPKSLLFLFGMQLQESKRHPNVMNGVCIG